MRKKRVTPILPLPRRDTTPTPGPLKGVRLPPFSSDNTACVKCGHRGAGTSYHNAGLACAHTNTSPRVVWGVERLHRSCNRCGFAWDEACVPAIPQSVQQTMVMPVVRG